MAWFFSVFLCLFTFFQTNAFAYPGNIGFGYSSCLTCHFQPAGGGPINPYARAVQATEFSGNLFKKSMGQLETFSEFPVKGFSEKLELQSSFRGLLLTRDLETPQPSSTWITMQADLAARVHLTPSFQAIGSIGYVPAVRKTPPSSTRFSDYVRSREHYLAFRPEKAWGFYAGFLDPVFGLRIPEHNSFIRSNLLLNINDQVHGVLAHHLRQNSDLYLHLFLGNLYQNARVRPVGFSSQVEFEVTDSVRLGSSVWWSKSDFRERQMVAGHVRAKIGKGSSILFQTTVFRQLLTLQNSELGMADFAQLRLLLSKGIFGLLTVEHWVPDLKTTPTHFFRLGPTLEYLPFPKLEIRADLLTSKAFDRMGSNPIDLSFQLQTHLWL